MTNINSEIDFENHIRKDIVSKIIKNDNAFKLFNFKKAVDILIAKNGLEPKLFFIEVKYHKKSHSRLGFGQSKGAGFQPEVLKDKTDYFENNLLWILGHEENEGYWLVSNNLLRKYLNGDKVEAKYNGIRTKIFKEVSPLTKDEIINQLSTWLFS